MHTNRRLRRWIALLILGALAFAQASIAAAACEMDRRALPQAVTSMDSEVCDCEMSSMGNAPFYTNRCLAHCTADLQIAGLPVAIVRSPADVPVLFVPLGNLRAVARVRPDSSQTAPVPIRILLHSFLV